VSSTHSEKAVFEAEHGWPKKWT